MLYVWDLFVRLFHWSLVAAFGTAFFTHQSEWDRLTHANAGYIAGALIIARIIWGVIGTGYANFHSFPPNPIRAIKHLYRVLHGRAKHYIGHNPTGSIVIYAMLAIGLIAVGSGCMVFNDTWQLEDPEILKTIHHFATWSWLALVVTHVIGVIFESVVNKDNLILAMITGSKRVCKVDDRFTYMNERFKKDDN